MAITRKKLVEVYTNGKMTAKIFRVLNEADEPMTEKQLKEKLGLKKVKVLQAVLTDLSSPKASVVFDPGTKEYRLTELGKVMARQFFMKQESEAKAKTKAKAK